MSEWIDHQGGSVRADGGKIGEFPNNGRFDWWFYPPNWRPRGDVEALGPFNSRQEAKLGAQSYLGLNVHLFSEEAA